MQIKIQDKCRLVNGKPVKTGDLIETDANTARNLILKGFATPADKEAEKLSGKSILSATQAQAQILAQVSAREAAKAQAEAARPRVR